MDYGLVGPSELVGPQVAMMLPPPPPYALDLPLGFEHRFEHGFGHGLSMIDPFMLGMFMDGGSSIGAGEDGSSSCFGVQDQDMLGGFDPLAQFK